MIKNLFKLDFKSLSLFYSWIILTNIITGLISWCEKTLKVIGGAVGWKFLRKFGEGASYSRKCLTPTFWCFFESCDHKINDTRNVPLIKTAKSDTSEINPEVIPWYKCLTMWVLMYNLVLTFGFYFYLLDASHGEVAVRVYLFFFIIRLFEWGPVDIYLWGTGQWLRKRRRIFCKLSQEPLLVPVCSAGNFQTSGVENISKIMQAKINCLNAFNPGPSGRINQMEANLKKNIQY